MTTRRNPSGTPRKSPSGTQQTRAERAARGKPSVEFTLPAATLILLDELVARGYALPGTSGRSGAVAAAIAEVYHSPHQVLAAIGRPPKK